MAKPVTLLALALVACADPEPCSVEDRDGEITISCPDGSTATIDEPSEADGGTSGADGADGKGGADGEDGLDGADGDSGPAGPAGEDGVDGADGDSGPAGPAGEDGVDGEPGADGAPGTDGEPAAGSGSRLELVSLSGEDGSTYAAPVYLDHELMVYCSPGLHADGSIRCLPAYQATVSQYSAIGTCVSRLAWDLTSSATLPKYATELVQRDARQGPLGGVAYRVYSLGPAWDGPTWLASGTQCVVSDPGSGSFFQITTEAEASRFVRFTQAQ